jgi:hypothetical protein
MAILDDRQSMGLLSRSRRLPGDPSTMLALDLSDAKRSENVVDNRPTTPFGKLYNWYAGALHDAIKMVPVPVTIPYNRTIEIPWPPGTVGNPSPYSTGRRF